MTPVPNTERVSPHRCTGMLVWPQCRLLNDSVLIGVQVCWWPQCRLLNVSVSPVYRCAGVAPVSTTERVSLTGVQVRWCELRGTTYLVVAATGGVDFYDERGAGLLLSFPYSQEGGAGGGFTRGIASFLGKACVGGCWWRRSALCTRWTRLPGSRGVGSLCDGVRRLSVSSEARSPHGCTLVV